MLTELQYFEYVSFQFGQQLQANFVPFWNLGMKLADWLELKRTELEPAMEEVPLLVLAERQHSFQFRAN